MRPCGAIVTGHNGTVFECNERNGSLSALSERGFSYRWNVTFPTVENIIRLHSALCVNVKLLLLRGRVTEIVKKNVVRQVKKLGISLLCILKNYI